MHDFCFSAMPKNGDQKNNRPFLRRLFFCDIVPKKIFFSFEKNGKDLCSLSRIKETPHNDWRTDAPSIFSSDCINPTTRTSVTIAQNSGVQNDCQNEGIPPYFKEDLCKDD